MPKKFKKEYYGKISEGQLWIINRPRFDEDILTQNDMNVKMTVEQIVPSRSQQQLRYYYGVVVPMVHERLRFLGWDVNKEDTHRYLTDRFIYDEIPNSETGEIIKVPKSMSEGGGVDKWDFSEIKESIQRWAKQDLDIYIPDPNEYTEETI